MDGNKRTSLYLAILLIRKSGYKVYANHEATVETILAVARGEMSREELAEWIRKELLLPNDQ